MKFKFMAAILGLGLTVAISAVVFAQSEIDLAPGQDAKPSAGIQAPAPSVNDQAPADQASNGQASNDEALNEQASNDAASNSNGPGSGSQTASAPAETNGVARISLIHGDVSTQRGDSKDWSAAALNAPLVAGDRVSTGDKARSEIQLDYANMLRLAEHTQANITALTHSQIQIQLGHGLASYSVFGNSDADAEIDTPNVAIHTERREASFRILVTADDHTEVIVRKGEVEVTTPQGGTRVAQGQSIVIQGTGDQEQYKIGPALARDDWDQWVSDRDNMIRNAASRKRTNDYYVGAEDLDSYGTWTEVPDYGPVWRPTVSVGWAPYRAGHWVYEPYWGWTWVSYDPWGWAPYHYGRWMMYDGWWGWWPGPVYGYPYYRPIWAPAYVSFFGWGRGFGFGFGFGWGSIGWLPLGPCDFFHPWWGRWGGRYGAVGWHDYNRGGFAPLHGGTRFSNVNLALHDEHFRGGTTVSGNEFGKGHMSAEPMNHAQFQNAHFSTGKLPMTPSRESYSASGRPAAASTTRNVSENQHFFSARSATASPAMGRSAGNGREVSRPGNGGPNVGSNHVSSNNGSAAGSNNAAGSHSNSNSNAPRSSGPANSSVPRAEPQGNSTWGSAPRPGNSGGATPSRESGSNNGGWQRFSPMPPRASSESGRGGESSGPYGASRGSASEGRGYGGYSRPPLNMRQPIVTPRAYGGGRYGGGRPAPSYGGGRSASSHSSGHSAPSGGSSHGGGGSSHSSGGSSHGGGGGGGGGRHGK
jgi:hypothetical protein